MEAQIKERDCPPTQKNSPHWSHWYWLGNQIVRHHQSDWEIKEECHDRAHKRENFSTARTNSARVCP